MKVYGLWYGGPNYSSPELSDLEEFDSIQHAKAEFESRAKSGNYWPQTFVYVNKESDTSLLPCIEDSEMRLFFYDPTESDDPHPDRIVSFGPNGEIRVKRQQR